jgi:hypothetical protein
VMLTISRHKAHGRRTASALVDVVDYVRFVLNNSA